MLVTSWEEIITSWFLLQNIFILRRPKVTNFADIIKIKIIFIKKTFEGSKIVKRMRNRHLKCNLHLYYLIYQSGPNEPILCTTNARFCGKQQSCHLNGCHTTGINSLFIAVIIATSIILRHNIVTTIAYTILKFELIAKNK